MPHDRVQTLSFSAPGSFSVREALCCDSVDMTVEMTVDMTVSADRARTESGRCSVVRRFATTCSRPSPDRQFRVGPCSATSSSARELPTVEGTRRVLTRKVSIRMPTASPTPMSRTWSPPGPLDPATARTPKVPARTSPAEVIVGPEAPTARMTASRREWSCASSLMRVMTRML